MGFVFCGFYSSVRVVNDGAKCYEYANNLSKNGRDARRHFGSLRGTYVSKNQAFLMCEVPMNGQAPMSNLPDNIAPVAPLASNAPPAPQHQMILVEEYKDVSANLRQYANMRFAQLTLFVTITGALLALLFAKGSPLSQCQQYALEAFGSFIVLAFGAMEYRSTWWWCLYFRRALELERLLGLNQYTSRGLSIDELTATLERGKSRWLKFYTATYATTALLLVVVIGWLSLLLFGNHICLA